MKPVIETERLLLRKITPDDKEELFDLHSDPEVQKFTGEPVVVSMEEIEQSVASRLNDYKNHGFGRMAAIEKSTNNFIGWSGLTYLPEFDQVDLGFRFKRKYWGKGFATEVSKAIIEYGFNVLNLEEIIAIALPGNKASIRVMEKAGMRFDKEAPYEDAIPEAVWYKISRADHKKR